MKVHQIELIDRKLDRQQDGLTDIWKGDGQIDSKSDTQMGMQMDRQQD